MRRFFLLIFLPPLLLQAQPKNASVSEFEIKKTAQAIVLVRQNKSQGVRYVLQKDPQIQVSVESAGYFHPLTTPAGVVVTEVGPADHPHHRGVFLAWVEMHGKKKADFWGWGEHAPKDNRVIINRSSSAQITNGTMKLQVANDWRADDLTMMAEELNATFEARAGAHVLHLEYTLTPTADTTLSRWAFSGFCVRTRRDARLTAEGPQGEATYPDPKHTEPASDWPDAPWYAYHLQLPDGKTAGVAVINHPANPPALWHNHRGVRMLNPCIVAPGEVQLKAGKPLRLVYIVVAYDGSLPRKLLNDLSQR